ncbi:putative ribosomal protein L28e [Helianthus anomalus]
MYVFLIHKFLYDKGATNPEYVVTADEVDKLIVVADNYHKPDLKKVALARFIAVNRSVKVSNSGVKNIQSLKIRGQK